MPKDAAAALKGFNQFSAYGAVAGLNRRATRATGGAISLSISIHLPAIVGSIFMKPVTLPPGPPPPVGLLRPRPKRPRGCHAPEQRDELATPDASCHLESLRPEGWCGPRIAQSVAAFPKTRRAFRRRPRGLSPPHVTACGT